MENEYNPIEELTEHEPSVSSDVSESFSQQVYEGAESAVGAEGPLNKTLIEEPDEPTLTHAEGDDIPHRERSPERPGLNRGGIESMEAEAAALPHESQTKVPRNFLNDRIREICRSPMTWRVIKGILLVVVAIKMYQSLDTIEEYISTHDIDYSGLKGLFSKE